MLTKYREEAQLFADFANIESLSALTPGQRLVLEEQARHLSGQPRIDLDYLQQEAKRWITGLLDQGRCVVKPEAVHFRLRSGRFSEDWGSTKPGQEALLALRFLFHLQPFPFARCAVETCQRVFVREQAKKRYCSPSCTRKMVEARRYEKMKTKTRERTRKLRAKAKSRLG